MVAAWDGEELVRERKNDEDCDDSRLSDAHRYQSRHTGSQTERWRLRDESRPWDVLFAEEGRVMREVLRRRDRRFYSTARLQHAPRQLLACKNSYGTLKNSLKKKLPRAGTFQWLSDQSSARTAQRAQQTTSSLDLLKPDRVSKEIRTKLLKSIKSSLKPQEMESQLKVCFGGYANPWRVYWSSSFFSDVAESRATDMSLM